MPNNYYGSSTWIQDPDQDYYGSKTFVPDNSDQYAQKSSQPEQNIYKPGSLDYSLANQNPYSKSIEGGLYDLAVSPVNSASLVLSQAVNAQRDPISGGPSLLPPALQPLNPIISAFEKAYNPNQNLPVQKQLPQLNVPHALDVPSPTTGQLTLRYGPDIASMALGGWGAIKGGLSAIGPDLERLSAKLMGANPDETALNAVESLNPLPGTKNPISTSGQMLASAIKKNYGDNIKAIGSDITNNLNNPALRNNFVYEQNPYADPYLINKNKFNSQGNFLGSVNDLKNPEDIFKGSAADLVKNFTSNPTFTNGNSLRIQLGKDWADLSRASKLRSLDGDEQDKMNTLFHLRDQLHDDMIDGMNRYDPSTDSKNPNGPSATAFQKSLNDWKNKVVSYEQDPNIYNMAIGKEDNPGNIASIFSNPRQPTQQVINDLGNQGLKTIQYHYLAGKNTAQKFSKAVNNMDNAGFSQYKTPDIEKNQYLVDNQAYKQANTSKIKSTATAGMAWILSHMAGMGPFGEAASAAAGAFAPSLMRTAKSPESYLNKMWPVTKGAVATLPGQLPQESNQ